MKFVCRFISLCWFFTQVLANHFQKGYSKRARELQIYWFIITYSFTNNKASQNSNCSQTDPPNWTEMVSFTSTSEWLPILPICLPHSYWKTFKLPIIERLGLEGNLMDILTLSKPIAQRFSIFLVYSGLETGAPAYTCAQSRAVCLNISGFCLYYTKEREGRMGS